jgi:nitroreductase
MDFQDVLETRHSIRKYEPLPVAEEKLARILEAARTAPTAHNNQPFRVIVIHTEGREEELKGIYGRDWFVQPPLILAVVGVRDEAWVRKDDDQSYLYVDAAIAMDHMILAATDEGLGTCWIAAFDPAAAREVLGLPEGVEPIVFTPLGYPAQEPRRPKRKPLDELVKRERWS